MRGGVYNPTGVNVNTLPFTRLKGAISGSVAYTGIGFKPRAVVFFTNSSDTGSVGVDDGTNKVCMIRTIGGSTQMYAARSIYVNEPGAGQWAIIASMDADGFTLSWTKDGVGTSFDLDIIAICFR